MSSYFYKLFRKELDGIVGELNHHQWLPFIGKGKVLRLLCESVSRLTTSYCNKVHENSLKTLERMNELDTLFGEREKEREEQFSEHLDKQKKAIILASSKAFCQGVCPERSKYDSPSLCGCQRRNRYAKHLAEYFDEYMAENAEKIENEYKESTQWKNQSKM